MSSSLPITEKSSRHDDDGEKAEMASNAEDFPQKPDEEPLSELPVTPEKKYSVFTTMEKRGLVFGAAVGAFFSPLSAQIYFPALDTLSRDLHVSITEGNLTVTTYMIVQAIAPMFVGSLADSAGRRPAYILCLVIYIGACIGCALAPNYAALLVLRALQAVGSASTVSICQAVVADVITSAERGSYVGFTSVPIILAPSVGPVIGGVIAQYLGWRWIFWILTILAGVVLAIYVLFMPETCRILVGDGSIVPHRYYLTVWQMVKSARRKTKEKKNSSNQNGPNQDDTTEETREKTSKSGARKPDLTRTLSIVFEKMMFLLLMYSSLIYAGFYAVATAIPAQFSILYGFDGLKIGLVYIPLGVGSIVSVFVMGRLANWNYRRHCAILDIPYDRSRQLNMAGFPIEQARLQISLPFLALYTVVLIGFGWAIEYKAHIAVAIVLLFLIGVTVVAFSNLLSTLIVDVNPGAAGAASASNNLTRCLVGAGASAAINPLMTAVGAGWAFTIIALSFVLFFPMLWMVLRNGVRWRKEKAEREEAKRMEKA
ncbi:major facilitator superfamily domain-containing protein [Astrocystis sublimbata]|nr:major facilitator superfamily domain-containing protein [Astrocystis sublimbata]